MGIQNIFLLSLTCVYLAIFILSFLVCVPAGININTFDGHCLLYASGKWNLSESREAELTYVNWGPSSACNFTIFIGIVSIITSLFYLARNSFLLAKGIESSWLDAFINLIVNSSMCICLFSTALAVSVGFHEWCNLIKDPLSEIDRCEDGQYRTIGKHINVDTENYYIQWQVAQFGIWTCWIGWLILSVMSLIRIYRSHRQEPFTTSMSRERQRLLAHVGHNPVPT